MSLSQHRALSQRMQPASCLILLLFVGCSDVRGKFDHTSAEKTHLRSLALGISMFRASTGHYPDSIEDTRSYDGDFCLTDQWGTPIIYSVRGEEYHVRSAGPDRTFETDDDLRITNQDVP